MTSVTGAPAPLLPSRRAPLPGDVGHLGTCPLCSHGKGAPPCLACRDELRARVLDMYAAAYAERALN